MNESKKELRRTIKQLLAEMTPQQAALASQEACENILDQREFSDARNVMIFLPIPGEIDARSIARAAWAAGKRVSVPKVFGPGLMEAVEIFSLETGLETSKMGIPEPVSNKTMPRDQLDLIIVPGLAFDRKGHRLGRGGGFYDRFLGDPRTAGALLCGLAFSKQVVDSIPIEAHDRTIQVLATDEDFLRFGRNF